MGFFENTRIDAATHAELSAVTYTEVVLDAGSSVVINGIPLTNVGAPQTISIKVESVSSPSGNVYVVGTPIEADVTPVVITTSYFADDYILDGYFETTTT